MWPNRTDMPHDFGTKEQKLKRSDVRVVTRGGLTDRQEVYMQTNTDPPQTEGNFCDNSNHHVKPHRNRHMGHVNSFILWLTSIPWIDKTSSGTWNYFPISESNSTQQLDTVISCGVIYTYRDIRKFLVTNLIQEAGKSQNRPTPTLVGRPSAAATNVLRLESCHNKHWPEKSSTQLRCRLCSSRGQIKGTVYMCARCDVGLRFVLCFEEFHRKVNL